MSAATGLQLALDLATRQRDDAGLALAQVARRCDYAHMQMEQLRSYAADTASRWSVASQTSTTPQIVGHYYQFMERLDQTIEMQLGAIAEVQRQREIARQVLLQAEVRMAGLQCVLERRRAEQTRAQAQREQRQSDELAAQMHRRVAQARENRGNT